MRANGICCFEEQALYQSKQTTRRRFGREDWEHFLRIGHYRLFKLDPYV